MRIQILSDLHLETGPVDIPEVSADVTILAGDIWTKGRGVEWAAETFPDRPVLHILGNHEYYGSSLPRMLDKMRERAKGTHVHITERDELRIHGVRFLGCTLWTDFGLNGDPTVAMDDARQFMNDYKRIRVSPRYRRLRPTDTLGLHRASVRWLEEKASETTEPKIVVIHHAPSPRCAPGKSESDRLAPAYASDLEDLVEELRPKLWIHGHVHRVLDQQIRGARVLANCRGYAQEEVEGFDAGLIVEV